MSTLRTGPLRREESGASLENTRRTCSPTFPPPAAPLHRLFFPLSGPLRLPHSFSITGARMSSASPQPPSPAPATRSFKVLCFICTLPSALSPPTDSCCVPSDGYNGVPRLEVECVVPIKPDDHRLLKDIATEHKHSLACDLKHSYDWKCELCGEMLLQKGVGEQELSLLSHQESPRERTSSQTRPGSISLLRVSLMVNPLQDPFIYST
jgi:hypothetical protein